MAALFAAVFGLTALLVQAAVPAPGKVTIPLRKLEPAGYYVGELDVGTPAQNISGVFFSTVFSDLWLNLRSARSQENSASTFYDPEASSTHSREDTSFQMTDFSGGAVVVSGFVAKDDLRLGNLVVKDFAFGAVANGSAADKVDGLVGLTPRRTQRDIGTPTIMERLVKESQIDEAVFAMYLSDDVSELTIGGVNDDHADGDFHFVDLSHEDYWQVPLEYVEVGDVKYKAAPNAMVTADMHGLAGPRSDLQEIAKNLGIVVNVINESFYEVDCNADVPELSFMIGGHSFELGKEDLVASSHDEASGEDRCHLEVEGWDNTSTWVLGRTFMKKYYVQFDYGQKRLGFATAQAGSGDNFV